MENSLRGHLRRLDERPCSLHHQSASPHPGTKHLDTALAGVLDEDQYLDQAAAMSLHTARRTAVPDTAIDLQSAAAPERRL